MLLLLFRILLFGALVGAMIWAVDWLLQTSGSVRIQIDATEYTLRLPEVAILLMVFAVAVLLLWFVAGFLKALWRSLIGGSSTPLARFFGRSETRRGLEALTDSAIALAAGDGSKAVAEAERAERKLRGHYALTRLLKAQGAAAAGRAAEATGHYKRLVAEDRTRFVGIRGLMQQKLEGGETDTALKLAEKAFALRPRHRETLRTLFQLQADAQDWTGARNTLRATVRAKELPRDVGARRLGILSLADARARIEAGDVPGAREAALEAVGHSPGLVPAAVLAAELEAAAGNAKDAERLLRRAWEASPHPDLAAVFASIHADESAEERLKRFQPLLKVHAEADETKLLRAELLLAAEDFPGADRAIGDLAESHPTARALAIRAAIARGQGAADEEVRGWLSRALTAPRGPQWVCSNCNAVHGDWQPRCPNCNAFDTLSWTEAQQSDENRATAAAAMLPIVTEARRAATEAQQGDPEVLDGEGSSTRAAS